MAAFSLNKSKGLPAGEGGFFLTNNERYYKKAKMVYQFGELDENKELRSYNSYELGWMYKSNEFVAAIACSHLNYLDVWNKMRLSNVEYLNKKISTLQELEIFDVAKNYHPAYWRYAFKIKEKILDQKPEYKKTLSNNLKKWGLKISQWQNLALPDQPVIKNKVGYGNGCPWVHGRDVNYRDPTTMQNTKNLINRIIWLDEGIQPPNSIRELDYIFKAIKTEVSNLKK